MSDHLTTWEHRIVRVGLFLVFITTFLKFVGQELWHAIEPLIRGQ
jgi:hypothetical protein